MSKNITADVLKEKIDRDQNDFYLVDVLSPQSYEARHVPTAVNIPAGDPEFVKKVEELGPSKDSEVVVYCSSETCQASVRAADALEQAGFNNVVHFSGGLAGWQEAGYEFASKIIM